MLGFLPLSARSISGLRILENPVIPVTDTHDYPFGALDYLRKRQERQARLRHEQEEKDKANSVRQQIEDVLHPPDIEADEEETVEPAPQEMPQNVVISRDLLAELAKLEGPLLTLHAQEVERQKSVRRAKDEEDMKVILRLLQ